MRGLMVAAVVAVAVAGCSKPPVTVPEAVALPAKPPGFHMLTADVVDVGRLKYVVDVPPGYDGKTPVPLVLLLHYGYEGPKPEAFTGGDLIEAWRPGLGGLGAVVVAPDVVGGNWTDPRNERAAVWLTRSAMKTYTIDPKRVAVAGFSMGGQGAWFIGGRHQDLFTAAVPVAAPPDGADAEWKIPVYVIHSEADDKVKIGPARAHAEAMKAKGATVEFKAVPELNHFLTDKYAPAVGEAVAWLQGRWK